MQEERHIAVDCNMIGSKKLKMYVFGILGQGFYAFDLPEENGRANHATGLTTVFEGEANEEKLDKELLNILSRRLCTLKSGELISRNSLLSSLISIL
jgi:hypothetical protein